MELTGKRTTEFFQEKAESLKSMRSHNNQLTDKVRKPTRDRTRSATTSKPHANIRRMLEYNVKCQRRVDGFLEAFSDTSSQRFFVREIIGHLEEKSVISNTRRTDMFNAEKLQPRTLLLPINNVWVARELMSKVPFWRTFLVKSNFHLAWAQKSNWENASDWKKDGSLLITVLCLVWFVLEIFSYLWSTNSSTLTQ